MRHFFAIIPILLLVVASAHSLPLDASNKGASNIPYEKSHFDVLHKRRIRNGLKNEDMRWPNATVPYVFGDGFDESNKTFILETMDVYHNLSCVKFVPRTDESDYIYIVPDGNGCTSYVGRIGGPQNVSFNVVQGCVQQGVILHELMHALGFEHEHEREDRDDYVRIVWENINQTYHFAFEKMKSGSMNDFGVGYDFNSIMHYTRTAFSIDGNETIIPLQDNESLKLGEKYFFSEKDILKIRRMYKCEAEESIEEDKDVVLTLSENIEMAYNKFKKDGDFKRIFTKVNELFMNFFTGLLM